MQKRLKTWFQSLQRCKQYSTTLLQSAAQRGVWALFWYALLGALILPIPIDSVLSGLILGSPKRWLRLTLAFTLASIVGGIATYGIGYQFIHLLGHHLINLLGGETTWQSLVALFQSGHGAAYLFTVSLIAGPYKLSILAAGATGMNFTAIMLILLITRSCRFLAIAVTTRYLSGWLPRLKNWKRAIWPVKEKPCPLSIDTCQ